MVKIQKEVKICKKCKKKFKGKHLLYCDLCFKLRLQKYKRKHYQFYYYNTLVPFTQKRKELIKQMSPDELLATVRKQMRIDKKWKKTKEARK